jgi:protein associated with RNAse G/E
VPLDFLHKGQDEPNSWQNIIGLVDIWIENAGEVNEVSAKSLIYILLKAFTYYFVTLQIQVFEAKTYKLYIQKEFKKYLSMAEYKGKAILWRFNN